VPAENAASTVSSWTPFAKALEKEIGIPVEIITTTSYAGVTEALVAGRVDLGMYGPFSYYLAKASGAKIEPVAVYVSQIGRPPTYFSVLVSKSSRADIRTIADVKGKKVCFVDQQSTSGYLYPFLALVEAGIDPEKDITAVFAGGHDRSAIAVNNGTCDAGFAFENMVLPLSPKEPAILVTRGQIKDGDLKLIQKSKPIPESPLAIRTDLPADLVARVKAATVKIDALYLQANKLCPTGSPNCGIFGATDGGSTFIPATESFFDDIRTLCTNPVAPKACKPA
jgi:phosphonate transport system substrate-binding protein